MSDKPYNLILVDGSSYLYRAFHALPPLTNSKGAPTGAVYGVLNMIKKLLTDYNPDYVAIVFDAKGKSFRHDIYSDYKANRPTMPLELQSQVGPLYELIQAMGLPLLVIDKVEADDVIATLAVAAETAGLKTLISTGDKDIAQLVNDNIHLINTMSNKLLDTVAVKDKFAVMPEQIVDYLALVGDSSDNIPGVPKVGPKTAAKWLAEYGTVAEIIKHADEVKGKVGENLRASLEQLPMAQKLATLDLKVALDLIPEELIQRAPDNKKLIELLQQMEFKKWLLEVLQLEQANNISNANYQTILTAAEFDVWLEKLTASASFAFDTETTALDTIEAEIVGVSFAVDSDSAAYVPLAHDYDDAPAQLDRDFVLTKLKPLLEDPDKIKIGQNLKYDMEVLVKYDIHMQGVGFDTMLESYVLDSTASRHDLDSLALKYLGRGTIKFSDVAGSGKKQLTFNQVPIEQAAPYAAEDAAVALQLHQELWSRLTQEPTLVKVLQEIEIPLVPVLARLELNGVMIDAEFLRAESVKLGKRIQELTDDTYKIAGTVFNLASPKQLQEILFEKLKLPVQKKTPGGQPSTAEGVLQTLALDYPLPKLILEYRSLSKLKSTYTDALPEQINSKTGRVHTSYNQAITATGRLSSTNPNLQNIPIRTPEGRRIRQAFIAPSGYKIVSADYSQIELRIMAHLSQDKGLLQAFANGDDIHQATAAEVFGVAIDAVTGEQRRRAKAINFGLIYGMSAFGLARQLGIAREDAEAYIELYFMRYPGVKEYMQTTRDKARKQGFVETLFGRRLYVPDINATNFQRQAAAERAAINAPMQGTAADIIKIAMINIDRWLQHCELDLKMIMQVHDELVFEVADKDVAAAVTAVQDQMVNAVDLAVPLAVHVGVGLNWDEAH